MSTLLIFLVLFLAAPLKAEEPREVEIKAVYDLASEGKLDEAIARFQALLREAPKEPSRFRLQYDLANLLFMQGRYREARTAYQRAIEMAEEESALVQRARERIAKMRERETKKKDEIAIQLIDIETATDTGQRPPEGSKEFLVRIAADPVSPHQEKAESLLQKIRDAEEVKAMELLNEARRLFDKERNYPAVLEILETIRRDYPENSDDTSVQILLTETERRLGRFQPALPVPPVPPALPVQRAKDQVPSSQEAR